MRSYPIPVNEAARQAALDELKVLDTPEEPVFDRITNAVRTVFGVPSALVSLVDRERQWFKSHCGLEIGQTSREQSICAHAIMDDRPLILPDTLADPRFASHPVVAEPPHVRFYAGAPIILSSGLRVGSLCAVDFVPHEPPSAWQVSIVADLAAVVARMLEDRAMLARERELEALPDDPAEVEALFQRGEFVELVAHEFRTPVDGLLGLLDLLQLHVDSEEGIRLVEALKVTGGHLGRVIERIRHFSDISTGELKLDEAAADLPTLLEHVALTARPMARQAMKSVRLVGTPGVDRLYLDDAQICLALTNLVSNAVKNGGHEIELGARRGAGQSLEIFVRDNGLGGSRDALREIDRDDLVARAEAGMGMSLSVTRKLVELHGGELRFEDRDGRVEGIVRLPAWRASDAYAA